MIRRAAPDDMARIVEMAERFISTSEYKDFVRARPEALTETIARLAMNDDGLLLVAGSDGAIAGMLAMFVYAHPFSGDRIAYELAWWVEPEARSSGVGLELLKAAEEWAKDRAATAVQMIAPNERVGDLYRRLGYRPMETAFQRSL